MLADPVVEPAAGTGSNATSPDRDHQTGLACAGSTDQHSITLLGDEYTAGEIAHQYFVDRRTVELEVVEVLGERQFGDGELVFDRTRLLLVDLGGEQSPSDALKLMQAFDGHDHDLIEGGVHAVELKFDYQVEELGSFHQMVLLRLS